MAVDCQGFLSTYIRVFEVGTRALLTRGNDSLAQGGFLQCPTAASGLNAACTPIRSCSDRSGEVPRL